MNYKRKKSKRQVKCTMCTKYRWEGNSKNRSKPKEIDKKVRFEKEKKNYKSFNVL